MALAGESRYKRESLDEATDASLPPEEVPVTFVRNICWRWDDWRRRWPELIDDMPTRSLVEQLHDVWRVEVTRPTPADAAVLKPSNVRVQM